MALPQPRCCRYYLPINMDIIQHRRLEPRPLDMVRRNYTLFPRKKTQRDPGTAIAYDTCAYFIHLYCFPTTMSNI